MLCLSPALVPLAANYEERKAQKDIFLLFWAG
ncbi:hypothetical protein SGRA_3094 [Saprospira grandis str. Lewin]|uniref:Uncharacterized protein n=1 Tax=Saprospira grandis (strain Lewin) TaxID=984262 RepID=H6KZP6_SAPGL|nr:hypothetical protein SGRA_3094 [Saprospira grandis str. Lewin]